MGSKNQAPGVVGLLLILVLAAASGRTAAGPVRTAANAGWDEIDVELALDGSISEYRAAFYVPSMALGHDDPPDDGQAEARREAEMAAEATATPFSPRYAHTLQPRIAVTAPLLIGVDDPAITTYLVDPADGQAFPQSDGLEVWGAAYDQENQIVYISSGALLYRWPTNATPELVGTITSATSDANLSITGLAFHDDTLYGLHQFNSDDDPEGVFTIDPATAKATLYTQYDAPQDQIDVGGLAVDPATGKMYATNDAAQLRGLVTIESDGTVTVVAPYPAEQNDIDGLAIGNGRAYLVTDEPGDIYVVDLSTMTYEAPIANPWTTPQLFAGAAWLGDSESVTPSIAIIKTVGTNPNACAIESQIAVLPGTDVTYCYEVTNVGGVALSRHRLEDSELGTILDGFPYSLVPGASAFITATATINQTTASSATWTAFNPGPTDVARATATAKVSVIDDPTCYTLTLTHTGSGADPTASPVNSPGCVAGRYTAGEVITLHAAPAAGHRVKSWSGTANNGSTATTNNLTMPAANHAASVAYEPNPGTTFRAFAPSVLDVPQTCWPGPQESASNDDQANADGPLCSGATYTGDPDDAFDVFFFESKVVGPIAVRLDNHAAGGIQLLLLDSAFTVIERDYQPAGGYRLDLANQPPGRYYIVIHAAEPKPGAATRYTLRATFIE